MTWRIDNPEDAWFRRARGPTIELWQKEDICQVLPTSSFTSSCQAVLGTPCWSNKAPLPKNLLIILKDSTGSTSFTLPSVVFSHLLDRSRLSWPGTAFFSLLPSDATAKSLPRWRLALAQYAVRGFFSFSSPCFPVASSHLGRIPLRCVVATLPWVFYAEHNCTYTASEEFSFKGHGVTRFLCDVKFSCEPCAIPFFLLLPQQSVPHPPVLCPL